MKKSYPSVTNGRNIFICIAVGFVVSVVISLLLITGLTSLIQTGKIDEHRLNAVFITRTLATLLGCLVGTRICNQKTLVTITSISSVYLFMLILLGVIIFDKSICNLLSGASSVIIGAIIALLIKLKAPRPSAKGLRIRK